VSYRPERDLKGYVVVEMRWASDNRLRPDDYDPICAALQRGDAWFHGESLYGDPCLIRLSDIAGVALVTPETVEAYEREEDERRAHKKTHGED